MFSPQQKSVGAREILVAVTAVIGVVILLGWISAPRADAPAAAPAPANLKADGPPRELDDPAKASRHADDLARQSGGDLNRLSEQDRRWLDASTAGHAKEFLVERLKALKTPSRPKPPKEKPHPRTP